MNTEHILLLIAIFGLITAGFALAKSYFEFDTARLKNELQRKINAAKRNDAQK